MRIIFFLLITLLIQSCGKPDLDRIEEITTEMGIPLETIRDVEVIYSDSAKVKAILSAPLMVRFVSNDPVMEMSEGVKVQFFDDTLNVNSFLRANYGIRYLNRQITEVRDDVFVFNTQGDTLNTEHLIWDENTEKIYSHEFVKVTTKDEIIFSEGFESNLAFTEYTFYKIRGTISLRE